MKKIDSQIEKKLQEIQEDFQWQAFEIITQARTPQEMAAAWKQIHSLLNETMMEYAKYIFIR